jgi:hypothetical protein
MLRRGWVENYFKKRRMGKLERKKKWPEAQGKSRA